MSTKGHYEHSFPYTFKVLIPVLSTLGSRGYFFLIGTDGWRRSCVNEEKNNLWSQEYATSFPCEKSVQNLNWVTDWILPCPQGINNIIMALIGYIEQLDMRPANRRNLKRRRLNVFVWMKKKRSFTKMMASLLDRVFLQHKSKM